MDNLKALVKNNINQLRLLHGVFTVAVRGARRPSDAVCLRTDERQRTDC